MADEGNLGYDRVRLTRANFLFFNVRFSLLFIYLSDAATIGMATVVGGHASDEEMEREARARLEQKEARGKFLGIGKWLGRLRT